MPQVNDLGVLASYPKRSFTSFGSEGLESCNLKVNLDLVQWITLGRSTDSKTVPGKSRVAVLIDCARNIAVVVVVVRKVPVTSIKANAVRHDLKFLSRTGIGFAICSGEFIITRNSSKLTP
jgi:hypothetical protein